MGMNLEAVIHSFIKNEQELYKLYHSPSFHVQAFLKRGKRTGKLEANAKEEMAMASCIEFLLKKEGEYLEVLDWENIETLIRICDQLWEFIPIKQDGIIEQYIENTWYTLPILRAIQLVAKLADEKATDTFLINEKGEEEEDLDTKVIERQAKVSATETVIDAIYPELKTQYMIHFFNIAYKNRINYKNSSYEGILNEVLLDVMYLSKELEEIYIGDCKENISYQLFLVEDIHPHYFDRISIGQEAILDNAIERLKMQLIFLSSKKRTRTSRVIFLRCLYMEMLCEEMTAIKRDALEDFAFDNQDMIKNIPEDYIFPILEKLREAMDRIIDEQEDDIRVEDSIDEKEGEKIYQKK